MLESIKCGFLPNYRKIAPTNLNFIMKSPIKNQTVACL